MPARSSASVAGSILGQFWRGGNRKIAENKWFRRAVFMIALWPVLLMGTSFLGVYSDKARALTASLAFIPLIGGVFLAAAWPLLGPALAIIPWGRALLRGLVTVIVVEMLLSIIFAIVPVAREPVLIPAFMAVVIAAFLFAFGAESFRWIAGLLTLVAIGLTIFFFLGGHTGIAAKEDSLARLFTTKSVAAAPMPYPPAPEGVIPLDYPGVIKVSPARGRAEFMVDEKRWSPLVQLTAPEEWRFNFGLEGDADEKATFEFQFTTATGRVTVRLPEEEAKMFPPPSELFRMRGKPAGKVWMYLIPP